MALREVGLETSAQSGSDVLAPSHADHLANVSSFVDVGVDAAISPPFKGWWGFRHCPSASDNGYMLARVKSAKCLFSENTAGNAELKIEVKKNGNVLNRKLAGSNTDYPLTAKTKKISHNSGTWTWNQNLYVCAPKDGVFVLSLKEDKTSKSPEKVTVVELPGSFAGADKFNNGPVPMSHREGTCSIEIDWSFSPAFDYEDTGGRLLNNDVLTGAQSLDTGDIMLMASPEAGTSNAIRQVSGGDCTLGTGTLECTLWTHVGIVLKVNVNGNDKFYVLEATPNHHPKDGVCPEKEHNKCLKDCFDAKKLKGVQVNSMHDKVYNSGYVSVAFRRLNVAGSGYTRAAVHDKIVKYYQNTLHGLDYGISYSVLNRKYSPFAASSDKFCSELVADVLIHMGLEKEENKHKDKYLPRDFSSEKQFQPIKGSYGPELTIKLPNANKQHPPGTMCGASGTIAKSVQLQHR